MAYDGFTVAAVAAELNEKITGGRVDKVHQPGRDDIVLSIRAGGAAYRLLLCAGASNPRAHLIEDARDNPAEAPQFCMLLRKRIGGGKIAAISQPDFDRVLKIDIDSYEELGDLTRKSLYIEMMGRHSNIILVDQLGFIIDSIHRVPHGLSAVRQILPKLAFTPPPGKGKLNPLETGDYGFPPFGVKFNGVSKQLDEYIAAKSIASGEPAGAVFKSMTELVKNGGFSPTVAYDASGRPKECACYVLDGETRRFDGISAALEYFYRERDNVARAASRSSDLRKLVLSHIDRCLKKRDILKNTIADCGSRETLRLYGELLTANAYGLGAGSAGASLCSVDNYYDGSKADIPLDPRKTPIENAQFYYKQYNKKKRALEAAKEQEALNEKDFAYLETVLNSLQTCETEAEIAEIRDELAAQGFSRRRAPGAAKRRKPQKSKPVKFDVEGHEVFVGKNNTQNDELTMKAAKPDDLWFHTKDIPGSHVLMRVDVAPPSDAAIERAARIAAYFSKARESAGVPVDYTRRRYIKKPGGAKPGFVIYTNQKTVYVPPLNPYL